MAKGKVTKVIDGDTFKIQGGKSVRLVNVRAPEIVRGVVSTQAVREYKKVTI